MTANAERLVTLTGSVPVYVVVNVDDQSIDCVVVDDENHTFGSVAFDHNGDPVTDQVLIKVARLIAEGDPESQSIIDRVGAEWPAWEFGW